MTDLIGKAALVTGGSRGIGAAIVRHLARGGADVAFTYERSAARAEALVAEIEALGRRGLAIRADSADAGAVRTAVDRANETLGRLDILVNNAGIFSSEPLEAVSVEELDRMLAIHVRAAFVAAQAASRHMGDGGRIVSIGSCLADRVTSPGITLYSMSKAALSGMTRGLARDLGSRGITANVVHPGPIDTDMNPADGPQADAERAQIALGQFGQADDIAAMVAHLAGPGGRYVTGASILVDGGTNA